MSFNLNLIFRRKLLFLKANFIWMHPSFDIVIIFHILMWRFSAEFHFLADSTLCRKSVEKGPYSVCCQFHREIATKKKGFLSATHFLRKWNHYKNPCQQKFDLQWKKKTKRRKKPRNPGFWGPDNIIETINLIAASTAALISAQTEP